MKKVSLLIVTLVMLLTALSCESGTSDNKGGEEEKVFPAPTNLKINTDETRIVVIFSPVPNAVDYNIYIQDKQLQIKQINIFIESGINDSKNKYYSINKSEINNIVPNDIGQRKIGSSAIFYNGIMSEITWSEPNF